jgi:quercetin dioxygenase-like cupin family protein
VKQEGIELTFITGDEGAGHGFHKHEDLNEILIFLDGKCTFTLDQTEIEVKGSSML